MNFGRRYLLCTGAVLAPTLLSGCASSPTHYYRLAALSGPVNNSTTITIRIRNVNLPNYLRQEDIAKPGGAYQYISFTNDAWAAPLGDMLQNITVQELGQRLPACVVLSSSGAIAVPADVLIEINVIRFDPDGSNEITLTIQIAIKSGQDLTLWLLRTFINTSSLAGQDAASIVATMSTLWARAMDQLAPLIAAQWTMHGAIASSR